MAEICRCNFQSQTYHYKFNFLTIYYWNDLHMKICEFHISIQNESIFWIVLILHIFVENLYKLAIFSNMLSKLTIKLVTCITLILLHLYDWFQNVHYFRYRLPIRIIHLTECTAGHIVQKWLKPHVRTLSKPNFM